MNIRTIGIGFALMLIAIVGAIGLGANTTQAEGRYICYDPLTANVRRADNCLTGGRELIFTSDANYARYRYGETHYTLPGATHVSYFAEGSARLSRTAGTEADRLQSCRALHRSRDFGGLWFGQGCSSYGVRAYEASR